MGLLQKSILSLSFAMTLAMAAAPEPKTGAHAFTRNHLGASLTKASANQKTTSTARESAAYVVAGSSLMSLGLLFANIRQRPRVQIQRRKI
jgi:hypothetical protein